MFLTDGRQGNVVLVGPRRNPKGAVLVLPPAREGGQVQTIPLVEGLRFVHPLNLIEALCVQERAFGKSGLAAPVEKDKG